MSAITALNAVIALYVFGGIFAGWLAYESPEEFWVWIGSWVVSFLTAAGLWYRVGVVRLIVLGFTWLAIFQSMVVLLLGLIAVAFTDKQIDLVILFAEAVALTVGVGIIACLNSTEVRSQFSPNKSFKWDA
jgi:hypothetical protein